MVISNYAPGTALSTLHTVSAQQGLRHACEGATGTVLHVAVPHSQSQQVSSTGILPLVSQPAILSPFSPLSASVPTPAGAGAGTEEKVEQKRLRT